ncbi:hypothetical protein N7541_010964 [Penicillium brevicompactum]|uniref:Secreted protein CSS2 C-terminal domain-containing protein n=1 Tax=Penicillium brevicompactum TaxID=5074 RepID=A0A9W9UHQ4_PENBR|nr:hypothetical protein N7452_005719 [Penicillium brevicompactum]KAJ5341840.1 hypothetical protein N7541_010964 [Penicillium brevicompactum]
MVNPSKIITSLLALGLVDRCRAEHARANETVNYVPVTEEWAGEGSNLTVTFDLVNANYVALYNDTSALKRRTGITTTVAAATVLSSATSTIIAAASALTIYEFIADVIKSKSNSNSCTMTYGTDSDGTYFEGYAYEATTSGSNCDTTAEKKTILAAVEKCANRLHTYGAVRGCCTFSHGGTWTGHLRLTAEPLKYPVTSVTC